MKAYQITNTTSGAGLGVYFGESEGEAIQAMLDDSGCVDPPSPDLDAKELFVFEVNDPDWGLDDLIPAARELLVKSTPDACPNCGGTNLRVRVSNRGGQFEFRADCGDCWLQAVYWTMAGLVEALGGFDG